MWFPASTVALALLAQASTAPAPPVSATSAATATANAAGTTAKPGDPMICKSVEETGSRFSHRTCHTAGEWAQITADARSSTEEFQRSSSLSTPH